MKNRKGFTLIELIAVILIIGAIMALSAPNVISMIDKNKRTVYIRDAKKMVKLAKYKFNSTDEKESVDICGHLYKLSELDRSDLYSPPNGGTYDLEKSYVNVRYDRSKYKYIYRVQLLEVYTKNGKTYYRGIKNTDSTNLDKDNSKMKYVTEVLSNNSQFHEPGPGGCKM